MVKKPLIKESSMLGAANRVRDVRKARGMGLLDLAEKIGVSMSTMSKLETGHIQLTVTYLDKLAKALNVPAASLLPRKDDGISQINNSLLADILLVVKELLVQKKLEIDPPRHAAIITRLYEEFLARAEATPAEIKREATNIISYESLAQQRKK